MQAAYDQRKIWAFHQNENAASFTGAAPRLEDLARTVFQLARRHGIVKPRVLNIGVGGGYFEELIVRKKGVAYSVDPDERALARLASKGVQCFVGTIERLPFAQDSLDFAVVSEVLEHLEDSERSNGLAEIRRVLKPGGYVLGTVPYRENLKQSLTVCPHCGEVFHRWGHKKEFDFDTMRNELEPHFDIQRMTRTAFVSFSRGSALGLIKSFVRLILAKYGEPIAVPSLYFVARKFEGDLARLTHQTVRDRS
jgi:SAM-dependent methyltransferase